MSVVSSASAPTTRRAPRRTTRARHKKGADAGARTELRLGRGGRVVAEGELRGDVGELPPVGILARLDLSDDVRFEAIKTNVHVRFEHHHTTRTATHLPSPEHKHTHTHTPAHALA